MKPFDINLAKQGAAVCTRSGRPARILCYDAMGDHPIIYAWEYTLGHEKPIAVRSNGMCRCDGIENPCDLMMVTEKHEGWIILSLKSDTWKETSAYSKIHSSYEEAIKYVGANETAVKIEWEE